jgi:hypothetical protein
MEFYDFPHIYIYGNFIIPIFFRGVGEKPPTSYGFPKNSWEVHLIPTDELYHFSEGYNVGPPVMLVGL